MLQFLVFGTSNLLERSNLAGNLILNLKLEILILNIELRFSEWLWTDHVIAMLYCHAVHHAGRILVCWTLCTSSVRILRVFGVAQYRVQRREDVDCACNRYKMRRPFGWLWSSMGIRMFGRGILDIGICMRSTPCPGVSFYMLLRGL